VSGQAAAAQPGAWGDDVDADAVLARAVAAIRETFEEAGVLLAASAAQPLTPSSLSEMRARLLDGDDFGALLEQAELALELSALQPLARWITPESERTRFDTSFFLSRAPADQVACHDSKESVAGDWFAPAEALEAARHGRIRLAPPTALTLEGLLSAGSVDAALQLAASRTPPVVLPIIRAEGPEVVILYPGDPDHPVSRPAFAGPTRRVLRRG
jgi:8-oxo-dGTP pyrophosphatase MutT (NUDIX family)